MMEHKYKPFLDFKTDAPGLAQGEFEAWVSTFMGQPTGQPDSYGDLIDPKAFDLDLLTRGPRRPLLWMHQAESPIGYIDLSVVPSYGLKGRGRFLLDVDKGHEAHVLAKAGLIKFSIGYEDKDSTKLKDGARLILQIKIWEASAVSFPANDGATLIDVRSTGRGEMTALHASLTRLTNTIESATPPLHRMERGIRNLQQLVNQ